MAKTPGPQQRFPSRIVRISFPAIGGLVYFRVQQRWTGSVAPLPAYALVEGLPWQSFNMFSVVGGEADSEGTPKETVPISDPVTDKMLTKYLYWAHHTEKNEQSSQTSPSTPFLVVDTANWTLVYDGHVTHRQTPVMTREAALAQFKGLVGSTGYEGLDPDKMGVGLYDNVGNDIITNPPDSTFWANVTYNHWTYHYEDLPGSASYRRTDTASIVLNLAKLFRDVPNLPNGKKPAFIDFTIQPVIVPTYPSGTGGAAQFWLQAGAYKPTVTKPPDGPKPGERNSFPVHNELVPTGFGNDTDFDVPSWEFPDPAADIDDEQSWTPGQKAQVRITFGVGKVLPKVEIAPFDGGGPDVG